ncbi:alpha/beta fold hydrolase [Microbacterium sp. p3-SID336]|uniref:alpha/beta fold hydrolase n=1 Tax=Microbacterium sp. p3-SID336 TaxID=2916212 RepID=UPI0021A57DB0|nr:alpha/beta fold hydrolase [Microbacterium sp. p3-SID336]MCT1477927.1 alpha/beta fold hydrolase [Microbacterium sp. p3-SID336]
MLLNVIEAGEGDRVAVLLHGMMGSAESWHRVVPLLVERGFRVLALDLPGHGLSPRDPALTIETAADAVIETLAQCLSSPNRPAGTRVLGPTADAGPVPDPNPIPAAAADTPRDRAATGRHRPAPLLTVAVGHSFGATVLAAAAPRLNPALAVYVDAPLSLQGGHDRAVLVSQYERDRRARMSPSELRRLRPFYSVDDATVEARAAERFDPPTAASVSCGADGHWAAAPGSIVVRAEPSAWVTDEDARRFEHDGVRVRSIPGAAHTVWYSHFEVFTAALPEVFAEASTA